MKKIILCLILFFFQFSYPFKPRNIQVFEKNCLRLLANHQYSFLSVYYLKHANNFKEDQRLVNLGLSIIRKCPLIKVKSEVLTYILKLKSKKIKKREIYYECGLLHYFQGRWLKALKFFSLSNRLLANYYMGECELKLGHFKDATYYFKQYLKKHNIKPTNNSLVLWVKYRLAEIAFEEEDYKKSYRLLLKSGYLGVERNILLYKIYGKTGEVDLKKQVKETLNNKYKEDIKANHYLKGLKN